MRVILDACVLFPTVQREFFLETGQLYTPLWSDRILDEWYYSVLTKLGEDAAAIASVEIETMRARFPNATVAESMAQPPTGERLKILQSIALPDASDRHVIISAIRGGADMIVTANRKDFPRAVMAALSLRAISPDEFAVLLWSQNATEVAQAAHRVFARAQAAGAGVTSKALFKRARLPRLAKALATGEDDAQ
ncbi:PIN domain-containing protein [Paracoccus sp. DMF-8]|uniref:RSP_2648 family PIN domain-containing protein n=1 Tax=Paracoccus sp. DMF-8 TaxID=3019445 RepID=UPI0023E7C0E6|nr:PIN domain-containing protein [Paracoccus sp. DMF-8]MDF3606250.1 PIN domain-containing protein [Paracoccus sp. DMF-8]